MSATLHRERLRAILAQYGHPDYSLPEMLRDLQELANLEVVTIAACPHGTVGYCETCALRDPGELGEQKPRLVMSSNAQGATTRPAEPGQLEDRRSDKPEVRTVRRKIAERGPCGYEETLLEIIGDLERELADLRHAASQVAMPSLPQEDPNDVAADVGRILRLQRKPVSDDKPQSATPVEAGIAFDPPMASADYKVVVDSLHSDKPQTATPRTDAAFLQIPPEHRPAAVPLMAASAKLERELAELHELVYDMRGEVPVLRSVIPVAKIADQRAIEVADLQHAASQVAMPGPADLDTLLDAVRYSDFPHEADAAMAQIKAAFSAFDERHAPLKLWLWKNFVDGRPEYWAYDNPYPCHQNGDPITLGEPCGYALVKTSTRGRDDVSEAEVITAIKRGEQSATPRTDAAIIRTVNIYIPRGDGSKRMVFELVEAAVSRELERELAEARDALHAAGDGDTWEAAYNRVMVELADKILAYEGLEGVKDGAFSELEDRDGKLDAIAKALDMPKDSWRIAGCDVMAHQICGLVAAYIKLQDREIEIASAPSSIDHNAAGLFALARECGWTEFQSRPAELFIRDRLQSATLPRNMALVCATCRLPVPEDGKRYCETGDACPHR